MISVTVEHLIVFLMLSNPTGAQNVSCLSLCSRDICSKNYALYGLGNFNPKLYL